MTPPFTSLGKEVLRTDQHYADALDPDAAQAIAKAMNRAVPELLRPWCARHGADPWRQ